MSEELDEKIVFIFEIANYCVEKQVCDGCIYEKECDKYFEFQPLHFLKLINNIKRLNQCTIQKYGE